MPIIKLTTEQIAALEESMAQVARMEKEGKPGAVFAQVYGDHMRVGIMSNEAMHKLYAALGTPPEKQVGHRSAYELRS